MLYISQILQYLKTQETLDKLDACCTSLKYYSILKRSTSRIKIYRSCTSLKYYSILKLVISSSLQTDCCTSLKYYSILKPKYIFKNIVCVVHLSNITVS